MGAAHGTFPLYTTFKESFHLFIEPLSENEEALKKICEDCKGDYVIAAAGSSPGKVIIHVHDDYVGSSIYREKEGEHVDGTPREVDCVTLDDLCEAKKLKGPYFIKIDVQGAELDVLNGSTAILTDTEAVLLEASLFEFHFNEPQLYDIMVHMKKQGFALYDLTIGNYRLLDKALGQLDLVFVKENGMFRKQHHFADSQQRIELTERLLQNQRKKQGNI